jgi:hypothetical protein
LPSGLNASALIEPPPEPTCSDLPEAIVISFNSSNKDEANNRPSRLKVISCPMIIIVPGVISCDQSATFQE